MADATQMPEPMPEGGTVRPTLPTWPERHELERANRIKRAYPR